MGGGGGHNAESCVRSYLYGCCHVISRYADASNRDARETRASWLYENQPFLSLSFRSRVPTLCEGRVTMTGSRKSSLSLSLSLSLSFSLCLSLCDLCDLV